MLNKKELRPFAAPCLTLDPDNGLFYAQQVDYIVCTDVRTIGNQDVLILHFLPREQAAIGDFRPVCTMFQGPEDYITLERDGGKTIGGQRPLKCCSRTIILGEAAHFSQPRMNAG